VLALLNRFADFKKKKKNCLFNATKSGGIQIRFLQTYKMSLGIEKYVDFNRFFCGMDFMRLFS